MYYPEAKVRVCGKGEGGGGLGLKKIRVRREERGFSLWRERERGVEG